MANMRTSSQKGTRSPGRIGRSIVVLALLLAAGLFAIFFMSDFFERGIREVSLPLRHENIIRQQSEEKEVDSALIAAVIYSESRFIDQTSSADARGLMQITPPTAKEIERLSGGTSFELQDLSDPDINIRYGTFYLAHLLDIYDGDLVAALAAYNAGPGNAEEWGGSEMTLEDIEFPETKAYVKGVLEKQRQYRHEYELELGY
ncbi:MAG: lytic transglycosylase domain-containing protein [Solirubrobacterales bacterium]